MRPGWVAAIKNTANPNTDTLVEAGRKGLPSAPPFGFGVRRQRFPKLHYGGPSRFFVHIVPSTMSSEVESKRYSVS